MNNTYIVKAGDTLYGISNQFGVSVTELAELNNVNANSLQIGQTLTIPINTGNNPNNMFMYTVKKGDTLYGIARKYNTTVQEIMNLNYLKSNNLTVGQVIRIPEMYTKEEEMFLPNYINYTVKKRDTLYSIARANNMNVNTIIKDNGLTTNTLTIGQILRLRVPTSEIMEEVCIGEDYEIPINSPTTIIYTVKKGDNLYNIAKIYNTSASTIMNLNNLTSTNLAIGQQLKIPTTNSSTTSTIYIVKSGDSLYSISRKFNTTVDSIKKKNNLTSNILTIGQQLII